MEPSPVVDWSLEGLESFKAHNAHVSAVHELVDALQVWLTAWLVRFGRAAGRCDTRASREHCRLPWVSRNDGAFPAAPPCQQSDSRLVMHVCLEYSVPHLGLTSELMYGGLGKVRCWWAAGWTCNSCSVVDVPGARHGQRDSC